MSSHNLKVLGLLVAAAVYVMLGATTAQATDYTWTGSLANHWWDESVAGMYLNWTPFTGMPGAGDTATFSSTSSPAIGDVYLNGDRTVDAVTFDNPTGTYTLKNGPGGTIPNILTTASISQTGNATGALNEIKTKVYGGGGGGGALALSVAAGTLRLSGQIGDADNPVTLTGNVTGGLLELVNTDSANANNIDSSSNVTVSAGGQLTLRADGTVSALGSGRVTLDGGRLLIQPVIVASLGLMGEYYGMQNRSNGPGTVCSSIAYMDQYSPGGANYDPARYQWGYVRAGAPIDFPGDADSPNNRNPFEYAAGDPVLDNLGNPVVQGNSENGVPGANDLAARWTGSIYIATPGTYRFQTRSDDGTCLWIEDTLVVANDYWQGFTGRDGTYTFASSGYYRIAMTFYEGGGGAGCDLRWDTTGGTNFTLLPGSVLYHGTGPRASVQASANISNPIDVIGAGSVLELEGPTGLGTLTLSGGADLTVTNGSATFAGTVLTGGSTAISTNLVVKAGTLTELAPTTLTKTGSGDLVFDQTAVPNAWPTSTVVLTGGRVYAVGKAGENDPLGGAAVQLEAGNQGLVLSTKGGDYALASDITANVDSVLQAKKSAYGSGTGTVTLNGTVTIGADKTLTVSTADGYKVNFAGTAAGGTLTLPASRSEVSGSFAGLDTINIPTGGALAATHSSVLGTSNIVNVANNGYLALGGISPTLPDGEERFPGGPRNAINVAGGGAIGGDLTNARYNSDPKPNVSLGAGAVVARTAGPEPVRADANAAGGLFFVGVTDLSGTYTNLGDDGATSVYRGAAFSPQWTPGQWVAGLREGRLTGDMNRTDPNPGTSVALGTTAGQTNQFPPWADNTTWVYTGQYYEDDGQVSFVEHIDDRVWLRIDGETWIDDGAWNQPTTSGRKELAVGWHDFEVRFSNGGGGAGAMWDGGTFGFGIDTLGRGTTNRADYVQPIDNGFMSLFRFFSTDFRGTLAEAAGASGFEVSMGGLNFGLANPVIQTAGGPSHAVTFTGAGVLSLRGDSFTNPGTTADTFIREGVAATMSDPGTTGQEVVYMTAASSLPAGRTLTVRNGIFRMADTARNAVADGATLNIGEGATYFTSGGGRTSGTFNILDGGVVRLGGSGWAGGLNWNDGATVIFDFNHPQWLNEGLPTDKALNIATGRWWGDNAVNQGLYVGRGSRIYGIHPTESVNFRCDNWGQAAINFTNAGPAGEPVIFSAPSGRELRIYKLNVYLAGADVQINDPAPVLLQGGNAWEENGMRLIPVNTAGTVRFWGQDHVMNNVTIARGYLDLGSHENGQEGDNSNYTFTGSINVRPTAFLEISEQRNLQIALQNGTLAAGGINIDNGGEMGNWIFRMTPGQPAHIAQAINFTGVGSGDALLRLVNQRDVGGTQQIFYYDNITINSGSNIRVQRWNCNREDMRLSINLVGGGVSYMRRDGDEWSYQNVTGDGEIRFGWTPNAGGSWWVDSNFYGTLGGTDPTKFARLTQLDGMIRFMPGSQMTDQGGIDVNAVPGLPGYRDGYIEVRAGPLAGPIQPLTAGLIRIGNDQDMTIRVSDASTGQDLYFANQVYYLDTKCVAMNGTSYWRGGRDDWWGNPDTPYTATIVYRNLHIQPGATACIESWDDTWVFADVFLDGTAADFHGARRNWDWKARFRNITGNPDSPGNEVLTFNEGGAGGWGRTRFQGVVTGADINWGVGECFEMINGFDLGGNTVTRTNPWSWVDYREDGPQTDPILVGSGTFDSRIGAAEDWRGSFYIDVGRKNSNLIGEAGWGAGYTFEMGRGSQPYPSRIVLRVDQGVTSGSVNLNMMLSTINVYNNDDGPGVDCRLIAEGRGNGSGYAVDYWPNVHLKAGAEVWLHSWNGALPLVDITLDEGDATVAGDGGQLLINAVSASGTDKTLIVAGTGGWTQFDARGPLLGTANMTVDYPGGGVLRLEGPGFGLPGFTLNGRTLTVLRTGSVPVELWPTCDPGAGLIKLVSGDLEIRRGEDGVTPGITNATNIDIQNGRMLRGFIREAPAQLTQEINAHVRIIDDGNAGTTDGVLASRKSDVADMGDTPGLVKMTDVVLGTGATVALQSNDNAMLWVSGLNLEGDATVVNSSSDYFIYLGNVGGVGNLTLSGGNATRLVGNLSLANTFVTGWGILQTGGVVTGNLEASPGGTVTVATPAAGGTFTVQGNGMLDIADAGFAPASMVVHDRGIIGLSADYSVADTNADLGGQTRIYVQKQNYAGTITLNANNTEIGGNGTDLASIISPLAGTATQVNIAGGNSMLTVGAEGGPSIIGDLGGPTSVNVSRNVRLASPNAFTGTLNVTGGTTVVLDQNAIGSGQINVASGAELRFATDLLRVPPSYPAWEIRGDLNVTPVVRVIRCPNGMTFTTTDWEITMRPRPAWWSPLDMAVSLQPDLMTIASSIARFTLAGGTLDIDAPTVVMDQNQEWVVDAGSTVRVNGNLVADAGAGYNITKTGLGTLELNGAANQIATLTVGTSPGGIAMMGSAASLPVSVLINAGSGYGTKILNHNYAEVDMTNSAGVLMLGEDTNANLAFINPSLSLGAYGKDVVYSGDLTPAGTTYVLGGGGASGRLIVRDVLADVDDGVGGTLPTDLQIGWSSPGGQDPLDQGMVILDAANTLTGTVNIYGAAGITSYAAISSAFAVNVNAGGSLDLGAAVIPPGSNIFMSGGGVSRDGGTLSTADLANLFPWGDYIIGGGGTGTTTVEDGALVSAGAYLIKVGTNTVELADPGVGPSANTYSGGVTEVRGGTLVVKDLTSLAYSTTLSVVGSGTAQIDEGGSCLLPLTVSLDDRGTLNVASGQVLSADALLVGSVSGTGARVAIGGGGTLDLGDTIVQGPMAGGAELRLQDAGTTLVARYGTAAEQAPALMVIGPYATLQYNTASSGNGARIGRMLPGGTLRFAGGLGSVVVEDARALVFDVDPMAYEAYGLAAFSSIFEPYTIDVGAGTTVDLHDDSPSGAMATAAFTDETLLPHKPVAYISKTGAGTLRVTQRSLNPGSADSRVFYWLVQQGTLGAYGDAFEHGLGATAGGWIANAKTPAIARQHLEGIEVGPGATLAWKGLQGFLPASAYGGLVEGDGFNPGEFILYDGATLRSSDGNLDLGISFQYNVPGAGTVTETYLCYPTVKQVPGPQSSETSLNITLGGNINFRSGIETEGGATLNVTVTDGDVRFLNDLPGAVGVDVIRTLNHQSGTTRIYKDHTAMQQTTVSAGMLEFNPGAGATIQYNGDMTVDGVVQVTSGTVNAPGLMTSTVAEPGQYSPGLYASRLPGAFNTTTPNPKNQDVEADLAKMDWSGWSPYAGQPTSATYPGGVWADNTTWVYTGEFYEDDGPVSFAENFDDSVYLAIDGQVWINDGTWNNPTTSGPRTLSVGWHSFEVRFGQGTGGVGPVDQGGQNFLGMSLGWDTLGRGVVTASNHVDIPAAYLRRQTDLLVQSEGVIRVNAGTTLNTGGFVGFNLVDIQGVVTTGETTNTTRALNIAGPSNDPTGKLDLTSGNLVVDYPAWAANPVEKIMDWVKAGYNGDAGYWDGNGITSSAAWDDLMGGGSGLGLTALGMMDNMDPYGFARRGDLEGTPVDETSILIKYTFWGDANLDGDVDTNDYDIIDFNWLFPPGTPENPEPMVGWWTGDFNYDGVIDTNDYDKIDFAFLFKDFLPHPLSGGGSSGANPIPEPATLALVGLGALAALASRRRAR